MSVIKLLFVSNELGNLIKSNQLQPCDLENKEKLLSLLTPNAVDKFLYLNNIRGDAASESNEKFINIMNLSWMLSYTKSDYQPGRDHYINNVLEALSVDGYEGNAPVIESLLHTFSLSFSFIKRSAKEYVVIFDELQECTHAVHRLQRSITSMDSLLAAFTEDWKDKDILKEPLYTSYLALKSQI